MRRRTWSDTQLKSAVKTASSVRQVIAKLGLIEAGGNYVQIKKYIAEHSLDTTHFTGKGWSKGRKVKRKSNIPTLEILVKGSNFQSFKLKKRLFKEGLKTVACEECGWAKRSEDGRIPLELDHINGDRLDNRLINLRVLCPNCHSLKPTHRGRNRRKKAGVAKWYTRDT
jgi:hypothetical protein